MFEFNGLREKFKPMPPNLCPGKRLVRRRGFVSSAGKLANHRLDESRATGPQPKYGQLALLWSAGQSRKR